MSERVLVTGADGFVGRYVCRKLIASEYIPIAGVRTLQLWPELQRVVPGLSEYSLLGDLSENQNLRVHLANVSAVVHLAARTPVMTDNSAVPSQDYRTVNATKSIALAAVEAGVRRLIFVSTVKVLGESTFGIAVFRRLTRQSPEPLCSLEVGSRRDPSRYRGKDWSGVGDRSPATGLWPGSSRKLSAAHQACRSRSAASFSQKKELPQPARSRKPCRFSGTLRPSSRRCRPSLSRERL